MISVPGSPVRDGGASRCIWTLLDAFAPRGIQIVAPKAHPCESGRRYLCQPSV